MIIEVELTPNPAALRFLLPRSLPLDEPVAFDREAESRPRFADRLLRIAGVADILLARDFVAVSRDAVGPDWPELRTDVIIALMEALEDGDDAALEALPPEVPRAGGAGEADSIEQQIIDILRTQVAPAVARDGGNITLVSYRDGVATVEMRGACGGCPSAFMTLKRGVEARLKRYVPELQRVEAVREAAPQPAKPFWKTMLKARGAQFRT